MKKGIYILPNSITLCGMFGGFFAIIAALKGNFEYAAWAIVIAGVCDGLDGTVARMTNTASEFGVQFDSLSDVIAFGVAPAVVVYTWALAPFGRIGWVVAFLYTACGALRLARFNIQKHSTEKQSFTGLPIPAAAGVVVSTILFYQHMGWEGLRSNYMLMTMIIISVLMVSTLRFHSFKELNIKGRKPFLMLVLLVVFFSVFLMHPQWTLFLLGVFYLWGGVAENVFLVISGRGKEKPAA